MSIEFKLPDVGEGMEEAEIVRWLVAPGDVVSADQIVLEIQTDKALVEIPSPAAGTIEELSVETGAMAKVGTVLFVLDDGSKRTAQRELRLAEEERVSNAVELEAPRNPAGEGRLEAAVAPERSGRRARAAPSVRRRARELGLDLRTIDGSGPGGRVLAEDVENARRRRDSGSHTPAGSPSADPLDVGDSRGAAAPVLGTRPLRGLRRATARAMAQSWSTIPHIHSFDEIDAGGLLAARDSLRRTAADRGDVIRPIAFFVAAAARALRRFPDVNASIDLEAETLTLHERVNIGVAVATTEGLIVPVVRDADRLGLLALATEIDRLGRAARERTVTSAELSGGTFTVSNYGSLGGRFAAPIIRAPEAAILGFGAVEERPWVENGTVVARPTLPICFGADHRLIDGDLSQAFQEFVKQLLADPVRLLLGE